MKTSELTILLIIITVVSFIGLVYNNQVTKRSHNTCDSLYEMIMDHNGSQESRQILENAYADIKNIELNQRNITSISTNRFIILFIFTLFSYKIDRIKDN